MKRILVLGFTVLFFYCLYNSAEGQTVNTPEQDEKIAFYWNAMERVLYAELPADTNIAIDCHQLDSAIFYFQDYIRIAKNTLSPTAFRTKAVYYLLALQTRFRYIYLRNPEKNSCYRSKNYTVLNIAFKIDPNNMMIKNNQLLFDAEIEKLEHNKTKETLKNTQQENVRQQELLETKAQLLNQQQTQLEKQRINLSKQDSILGNQRQEIALGEKKIEEQNGILSEQLSRIQTQRLVLLLFIIVLILVITLAFFIYRNYRHNKKITIELDQKNKKIEAAYQIIESTNTKLTDSINYALMIQNSILPPLPTIAEAFRESFILYKPKDIVAGDFYWFHETEDKFFVAAADSTGHGVPGALVSIICSEKLNEAIAVTNDVSLMLQMTNIRLKKVMHQSDGIDSTRDGMDVALCAFNKDLTELEYAGANRPLWIVRANVSPKTIEDIKPTKRGVGGHTSDTQEFVKHKIELHKGDTIYICSDGYADQFSPEDNKIMTTRFKEILIEINSKPLSEQKQHLHEFVENWRNGLEQTDDILVIGIRV